MKPSASMHPSVVLGAVLETLVRGRRVAILGDATLGLAERLSPRGARLVHAYDPDPARTAEAIARAGASGPGPKPVAFAVLEGDLGVRDGAFDVVVIPDLSAFADAAEVLRRARRLLPASGVLVAATPNPGVSRTLLAREGQPSPTRLDYYQLYDAVLLQFPVVRMLGQAPFVGYSVVDFAPDGEVEVSVDTSLLESTEEPEWFVAVAGERPAKLEPFTVVEVPFEEVSLGGAPAPTADEDDAGPASSVVALTEAQTHLTVMRTELERMRERERAEAERIVRTEASLLERATALETEVEEKAKRLRDLETRAGDSHVRAERMGHEIRDLEEELRQQRDRSVRLTKQLDDEKRARTKAEVELGLVRGAPDAPPTPKERPAALAGELDAARGRIAELESELDQVAATRIMPPPMSEPLDTPRIPRPADSQALGDLVAHEDGLEAALQRAADAETERDEARARLTELERDFGVQRALLDDVTRLRTATERELQGALSAREAAARRADQLEKELRIAERRLATAVDARDVDETRIEELDAEVSSLRDQVAVMHANAEELARRADEPAEDEAAVEEIERLEVLLRERGQVVAKLQRDLREGERIGRELVAELEAARAGEHESAPPPPAPTEALVPAGLVLDLTARLDALAQGAARNEADLVASRWRVAQLERELDDAHVSGAGARDDLERALAAAQAELAALRAARPGTDAVQEQSVLLHQLAGERADD